MAKKKRYKSFIQNHLWELFLLLLLTIPLFDLFHFGFPLTHDGHDHIARIANFYESLKDGILVPRWAQNLNWGYGHPILMFLYPLPSYFASLIHFLGFNLTDSTKIVFGLSFLFSGSSMYLWTRNIMNRNAAFVAAAVYAISPYRFIDFYVRGAIGEHVAFIFPPLVCYFLLKMHTSRSIWYFVGGALSVAGLILSHNAMSLMFIPFLLFYGFYLFYETKEKQYILKVLGIFLLGFGLASFFWIPALLEGKYTLRDIVVKGGYEKSFIDPLALFYGAWSYSGTGVFSIQVGIVNILFFLISPFVMAYLYMERKKHFLLIFVLLAYSCIAVFLMLKESNFLWQKILLLQNFQFPWRLLSVLVFTTALLIGFVLNTLSKKILPFVCVVVVILVLFLNKDYWRAKGYFYYPDSFYEKVYYGTTDTGESAPIWSVRFMEKEPKGYMEVISGVAKITVNKRSSTLHTYTITAEKESRIRENTLYFPGWEVRVNGKPVSVEFQDQLNRGLITFFVPQGKNEVNISFQETKLRSVADILSVVSILSLCAILIVGLRRGKHEKR